MWLSAALAQTVPAAGVLCDARMCPCGSFAQAKLAAQQAKHAALLAERKAGAAAAAAAKAAAQLAAMEEQVQLRVQVQVRKQPQALSVVHATSTLLGHCAHAMCVQ